MLNALQKAAAFLFLIGLEKAGKVLALMDSDEVKIILNEFGRIEQLSTDLQQTVWAEFREIGYEEQMNAVDTLYVLRQLFPGSKISPPNKKRFMLYKS